MAPLAVIPATSWLSACASRWTTPTLTQVSRRPCARPPETEVDSMLGKRLMLGGGRGGGGVRGDHHSIRTACMLSSLPIINQVPRKHGEFSQCCFQCWASVGDGGPTLKQHWVNDPCLIGSAQKTGQCGQAIPQ